MNPDTKRGPGVDNRGHIMITVSEDEQCPDVGLVLVKSLAETCWDSNQLHWFCCVFKLSEFFFHHCKYLLIHQYNMLYIHLLSPETQISWLVDVIQQQQTT